MFLRSPLHLYLSLYQMQIKQGFHMKTELGDVEARLRVSAGNKQSFILRGSL